MCNYALPFRNVYSVNVCARHNAKWCGRHAGDLVPNLKEAVVGGQTEQQAANYNMEV